MLFNLGATSRLALRIVDFAGGLDAETLRVGPGTAYTWDPHTGVFIAEGAVELSVADRAGNVSEFTPVERRCKTAVPRRGRPARDGPHIQFSD